MCYQKGETIVIERKLELSLTGVSKQLTQCCKNLDHYELNNNILLDGLIEMTRFHLLLTETNFEFCTHNST